MNEHEIVNYGNIQLMFESMPYTCHLWNAEMVMLDCNDASMKMFKVENKEDFKNRFFEFSPKYQPDGSLSIEKAFMHISRAFKDGICVFNWSHIASDGTPIPCKATAIRVDGKSEQLVVVHVIDMSDYNAMIKEIQQKDHLLHTVNRVAGILLQSPIEDFTDNLYRCMGMLAESVDADRVYIWKNFVENGELCCAQISEWSERVGPHKGRKYTTGISYRKNIPEWEPLLSGGRDVNGVVKDMSPSLSALLSDRGPLSVFVTPIFLLDQFWGFIGFDDCHNARVFSDDEASILRSAGLLLANSMHKSDMTLKLKEALEVAQEANHAKSIFLSNMSHEIRTPMNAIIGMGELLAHEPLNERQAEYVNDIAISAKLLLAIINDILDFSKIESGKLELNPIDYDFNAMVDNIKSMFIYIAQKKGIEFTLECADNLPRFLYGDDIRLRQVLTNICGNAIKFTESGYVRLKITASGDSLIFEIEDTGIGIQKEDMASLFNAFEQVDKSKNRSVVGSGLGLSICKSFVEMMDGEIAVKSEYGAGTVFSVIIPLIPGNPKNIRTCKTTTEEQAVSAPDAKILLIDDNGFNLKVARGLLGFMDIEAETADSGAKALKLVVENDYNIIFMDHMMPEMDGVETVLKIRELGGKYKDVIIIALTANAVTGAREMFLENGFNDFISKPIDANKLRKIVQKYLPQDKVHMKTKCGDVQTLCDMEEDLRKKSILTFARENSGTFGKLTDALSNGDIKTAHRIAHTLKGIAGYLGRKELSAAALSLEESLQDGTAGYTRGQLSDLERELSAALTEYAPLVREAENKKPETVRLDAEKLSAILAALGPLLKKGDYGAVSYAKELQGVAGMEELTELIDEYDFEGALQLLNSLGQA